MADITEDRITTKRCGERFGDPIAEGALIPAGAMYVLDADGNATAATADSAAPVRGIAQHRAHAAAGSTHVAGARGVYLFENSATAPLARADIGTQNACVEDCHTVCKGTGPIAGAVVDVTDEGVFVAIGQKV